MLDDHTAVKNMNSGAGETVGGGGHAKRFWVASFFTPGRFALQDKACRGRILPVLGSS